MGDVPALENVADNHTEGVCVEIPDSGGGFDDAAGDKASLPFDQLGGCEGVGEDEIIQTRDTAKRIQ